jgi:hypothetical protein
LAILRGSIDSGAELAYVSETKAYDTDNSNPRTPPRKVSGNDGNNNNNSGGGGGGSSSGSPRWGSAVARDNDANRQRTSLTQMKGLNVDAPEFTFTGAIPAGGGGRDRGPSLTSSPTPHDDDKDVMKVNRRLRSNGCKECVILYVLPFVKRAQTVNTV